MAVRFLLITLITVSLYLSLWKPLAGFAIPLLCLWGYGWASGFADFSLTTVIILSGIHVSITALAWWLSNRYREGNLAFTGAGITGFATAILAALFLGPLLGFFMWFGLLGRIVITPVALGFKPIAKSFAGGTLKAVYAAVMSGVLAWVLSG